MQGLTGILSSPILGNVMKMAQLPLGVMGTIRNMTGQGAQDALMKRMINYQKQMESIANNPAAIMARAHQVQQPLSTGLQENVMNDVQANLMQRGLTASPSIATQITSQALAPYEQRQQELALQTVMHALGLPMAAASATPGFNPTDTSMFWKQFLPDGGGAGPGIKGLPDIIRGGMGVPTDVGPSGPDFIPGITDFGGGGESFGGSMWGPGGSGGFGWGG